LKRIITLLLGAAMITTMLFLASTTAMAQNGSTSYSNQNCHINNHGKSVCGGRNNNGNPYRHCHYDFNRRQVVCGGRNNNGNPYRHCHYDFNRRQVVCH
jgi:hypothetical protein